MAKVLLPVGQLACALQAFKLAKLACGSLPAQSAKDGKLNRIRSPKC